MLLEIIITKASTQSLAYAINRIFQQKLYLQNSQRGGGWGEYFPGGPIVKNLPCNAGDTDLIPGWGTKSTHATEQLSSHTASTELVCSVHHN